MLQVPMWKTSPYTYHQPFPMPDVTISTSIDYLWISSPGGPSIWNSWQSALPLLVSSVEMKHNVMGQSAHTQTPNLISKVEGNIQASVEKYVKLWESFQTWGKSRPTGDQFWSPWLKKTFDPYQRRLMRNLIVKYISWIWIILGIARDKAAGDAGLQEGMVYSRYGLQFLSSFVWYLIIILPPVLQVK